MFYASSRRDATRCDAARHSTARQRARRDLESRQRTREMAITKAVSYTHLTLPTKA